MKKYEVGMRVKVNLKTMFKNSDAPDVLNMTDIGVLEANYNDELMEIRLTSQAPYEIPYLVSPEDIVEEVHNENNKL